MIKRLKWKIISAVICFVFIIVVAFAFELTAKDQFERNVYNIDARTDGTYLTATMKLEYYNNNNFDVDQLYFCLYPNAFKSEENLDNIVVKDKMNQAYPNGFCAGYINITDVFVNGEKAEFALEEDGQILKTQVGKIKKNKKAEITVSFNEKLPESPMRYGYGQNTYNFGNFYPVLCPFEGVEPVKSLYTANGDPFYSECADYYVNLTVPQNMRIASSGVIQEKITLDKNNKWVITGKNIRDFAFCMSEDFKLKSKQVGDTLIYVYYLCDDRYGENALIYAENALNCFNTLFGTYPYKTLSVAASDFYIGGMEYPNLVFINEAFYAEGSEGVLEEVIAHEVAHQWWYGVVGNNEIKEPWLDEGLTQYSVALYYENVYGRDRYDFYMHENESYCKIVFDVVENIYGESDKTIMRASNEFEHWLLYDAVVYDLSALMLDSLRETIGDKAFFNGIKLYYEDNKYKNADTAEFYAAVEEGAGKKISSIVSPWLNGKVYWG